jgi:F-type H+-transporting ATPase subunit a
MNEALQLAPGLLAAAEGATAEGGEHHITFWGYMIVTGLVVLTIMGILALVRQGINNKVFRNPWTSRAEQLYLFIENFAMGVIGPHGRKYIPMLMTFWLFIFFSNLYGLFLPYAPTGDLSSNLGMSIVAVMYVQWEGMKANGVGGHFKHFSGPKLTGMLVLVSGMIFLIEIISEAMKMVSLSLRLYGNIHGGHEVVTNLNNLGHFNALGIEWAIPVGALLLPVKLLTVIVQALVFTLLLAVYLSLVTHHEDDHSGAGHESDPGGHMLEPAHG